MSLEHFGPMSAIWRPVLNLVSFFRFPQDVTHKVSRDASVLTSNPKLDILPKYQLLDLGSLYTLLAITRMKLCN